MKALKIGNTDSLSNSSIYRNDWKIPKDLEDTVGFTKEELKEKHINTIVDAINIRKWVESNIIFTEYVDKVGDIRITYTSYIDLKGLEA